MLASAFTSTWASTFALDLLVAFADAAEAGLAGDLLSTARFASAVVSMLVSDLVSGLLASLVPLFAVGCAAGFAARSARIGTFGNRDEVPALISRTTSLLLELLMELPMELFAAPSDFFACAFFPAGFPLEMLGLPTFAP